MNTNRPAEALSVFAVFAAAAMLLWLASAPGDLSHKVAQAQALQNVLIAAVLLVGVASLLLGITRTLRARRQRHTSRELLGAPRQTSALLPAINGLIQFAVCNLIALAAHWTTTH